MTFRLSTEIGPGVHRIPIARWDLVNAFAVTEPDGSVTLVDAGLRRSGGRVQAALRGLGRDLGDVRRIVLTHAHPDHAGAAADLAQRSGAAVLAHERDAVHVREGRSPRRDPGSRLGRALNRMPSLSSWPGAELDGTFRDGEVLPVGGGARIVHTPGHSPGHVSVLLEERGVLLTGDAVLNVRGLRYAPAGFCTDAALARETAERLADLEFSSVAFMHGTEVRSGAREALRAFLRGRSR